MRIKSHNKFDLLRRSLGAFLDALLLQPRRLEDEMFQDIRFGVRMLARKPGFVIAATLCLALGMGANVLIFGLVNAMLLRPLAGLTASEQLAVIVSRNDRNDFGLTSYPDYQDYRDRSQSFSGLLAYRGTMFSLGGDGGAERIQGVMASGNYFSVLGVGTAAGRTFGVDEDRTPGAHPVAVISHGFWQRHFASDPAIIGKTVIVNAHPFTIIGVTQPGFIGTETGEVFDLWIPLAMQAQVMPQTEDRLRSRDNRWLLMIGRLKADAGAARAQQELDILSAQLRQAYPKEHSGISGVHLSPHVGFGPGDYPIVSRFLGTVLAIVALVLLIACANVANLLLVRAATRRKEIAIRLALGATRARIIRQFLTESMLLAAAGAGLGLLIPLLTKDWLLSLFLPVTPEALNFSPDARVAGFTVLLSLATALLFGMAPAIQSSRPDVVPELKEAAMTRGRRQGRLSGVIVIAQIAVTATLLVGAGLLLRTMQRLAAIDPGFATESVLALSLDLKSLGYTEAKGQQLYQQLTERITALPGVEAASLASVMPLGWGSPEQAVGRDLPMYEVFTMNQLIAESVAQRRFNLLLLGVFAVVALMLAAVGIYGVMAYSVAERTHEIGIRLALGARSGDVFKLIVGQGMRVVALGLLLGLAGAFALTRWMETLLFEVSATDPLTYVAIALLLAGVALLACFVPARRATKTDPIIALRTE
ncbi:MAG: ABC transporter permease [Blastocatellia bacterium]